MIFLFLPEICKQDKVGFSLFLEMTGYPPIVKLTSQLCGWKKVWILLSCAFDDAFYYVLLNTSYLLLTYEVCDFPVYQTLLR